MMPADLGKRAVEASWRAEGEVGEGVVRLMGGGGRGTPETPRWQFLLKASRGIKKKKEVFFSTEKERGKGEKKREREREGGREE